MRTCRDALAISTSILADWRHFFSASLQIGFRPRVFPRPRHTFACFRQIQRAFDQILRDIIGGSLAGRPLARSASVLAEACFTHDMLRYRRTLYERMGEFATLITGPSGTGKELAAHAIAQSRYLAFDDRALNFPGEEITLFCDCPISRPALSPTLVESELFGHRRGAFTGAIADRKGWLETCPEQGSVFLDELGDLDPGIQVKLLRVIEDDARSRSDRPRLPRAAFGGAPDRGRLIATRQLRSREGRIPGVIFIIALCSDQIVTPSLA